MTRVAPALAAVDAVVGAAALRHLRAADAGVIALYHRVGDFTDDTYPPLPTREFTAHLDLLTSAFSVVPLRELVSRHREGRSIRGCCAITFDDGFADFLTGAYPALADRRIPVTSFLVVDSLLRGRPTWNYRLSRVRAAAPSGHQVPDKWEMARWPRTQREDWLLGQESMLVSQPEPAFLRPSDLDSIDRDLVQWGSHSATHPNLPLCSAEEAEAELVGSRSALSDIVGEVSLIAYPNGAVDDATAQRTRAAGYEAGFSVGQRAVRLHDDAFALPRIDLGSTPTARLRLEIAGVLPALRRVRSRVTPR